MENRTEKSGYRLRGDETIEVDLSCRPGPELEARDIPLLVVHEDDDLAVIEKPAGLVVHPGAGTASSTLVHGLLFKLKNLSGAGGETRPGIVHRHCDHPNAERFANREMPVVARRRADDRNLVRAPPRLALRQAVQHRERQRIVHER